MIRLLARMASREAMRTRAELNALREAPFESSARERRAAAQVERLQRQLARSERHLAQVRDQLAAAGATELFDAAPGGARRLWGGPAVLDRWQARVPELPLGLPEYLGTSRSRSRRSRHHLLRQTARLLTEGLVFGFALFISLTAIFTVLALVF